MFPAAMTGPVPALGRTTVRSYPTHPEVQRALDHLSEQGFPVEKVSVVGTDLRLVEDVVGRLTRGRATLAGAASGAWLGVLLGLLLAILSPGGTSGPGISWTPSCSACSSGRRGVSRRTPSPVAVAAASAPRRMIVATTYDLQVDPDVADEARHALMALDWRTLGT